MFSGGILACRFGVEEMRVITGSARGKKLVAPEGLDTRPTGDRVKEGMFSAAQFMLEGADVLDLYAGSGQLGIEALSRGAATAVFVDSAKAAQAAINANLKNCGFTERAVLKPMDAMTYLAGASERFDIAFLDPPYAAEQLEKALPLVSRLIKQGGVVFCETAKRVDLPEVAGELKLVKEYRYGRTKVLKYRKGGDEE